MRKILKRIVMSLIWDKHRRELQGDMRQMTKDHPELKKKESEKGEKQWLDYWSRFGWKTDLVYYRVFSKFIKPCKEILPWDICRNFIEPILNSGYTEWFYNDKNTLSQIIPHEWMPMVYLRSVAGKVYDHQYFTPPVKP